MFNIPDDYVNHPNAPWNDEESNLDEDQIEFLNEYNKEDYE